MKYVAALVLLLALALAGAAALVYLPYGPTAASDDDATFVEIAPGTTSSAMAAQLEHAGVLRSRYSFLLLRMVHGGRLKAGEYRFNHPAPATEVYARILRGDIYTRALTIPEGYNIFDIAQIVEKNGFAPASAFLAAARQHTELIATLLPAGEHPASLEGYLFPDTYHFARHTAPLTMLTAMVHRYRQVAGQLGLNDSADAERTVILASLIEKEVSQASERPLVAGVFENRLAKAMPLATDPTVIYAALLDGRWRGTIYQSDLQSPSPYNTYRHAGLPPGPICNPGLASLRAALNPAQTDYLYFVADAAGHTRFSADLKQHAQQVQAYRQAVRGSH
ncbi:MAG: endolytic transglycosylase MltG [Acidobacteriota bacterium]|nr:endolytic transglycosylase MltG [Acidobacteriota bacterium]